MKKLTLIILACVWIYALQAQVRTDIRPVGLELNLSQDIPIQTLATPNMVAIHTQDAIADALPGPRRFAYPILVNYTLTNSGTWRTLDNGDRLWQLRVRVPGALSLHAFFNRFYLPEGSKLFVYSEETGQTEAITSEFLGSSFENPRRFATGQIYGETIVFEYFQPANVRGEAVIDIFRLDFGYRNVRGNFDDLQNMPFNLSLDCHIDINCWQGGDWQNWKRAVVRIFVVGDDGSGWCSGALINNTRNDFTPFLLTANHCLVGQDAINDPDASLWRFYWNYELSGCNTGTNSYRRTIGATVVANNSASDFALLRLRDNPIHIPEINPQFLGWDRSSSAPSRGYGIHHPMGDVRKISRSDDISNQVLPIIIGGNWVASGTHWNVRFTEGTTEGGSSGSPLINSAGRVVGQLRGGFSGCTPVTKWYGRFDVSWTGDGASDPRRRLRDWLDPLGANPTTLAGIDVKPTISGLPTICGTAQVSYSLVSLLPIASTVWSSSANITINATTGIATRNSVCPTGSTCPGEIRATVTRPGHPPVQVTRSVHVGTLPTASAISSLQNWSSVGNSEFIDVITYHGQAVTAGNPFGISTGQWQQIPGGGVTITRFFGDHPVDNSSFVYGVQAGLTAGLTGTNTIRASLQNHCGWGTATITYTRPAGPGGPIIGNCPCDCTCCEPMPCWECGGFNNCRFCPCYNPGGFLAFPNPVDNILTIDLTQVETPEAFGARTRSLSGVEVPASTNEVFYIRLLNAHGTVVRQQRTQAATVQFDVSNLPEGTYYLHIEHNGEIEKHQIIVQRN